MFKFMIMLRLRLRSRLCLRLCFKFMFMFTITFTYELSLFVYAHTKRPEKIQPMNSTQAVRFFAWDDAYYVVLYIRLARCIGAAAKCKSTKRK